MIHFVRSLIRPKQSYEHTNVLSTEDVPLCSTKSVHKINTVSTTLLYYKNNVFINVARFNQHHQARKYQV
jgi:hypothetical protein